MSVLILFVELPRLVEVVSNPYKSNIHQPQKTKHKHKMNRKPKNKNIDLLKIHTHYDRGNI